MVLHEVHHRKRSRSATNEFDPLRACALLRISIRAARYHDAELVSVGIGQDHPTDVAFADTSYEIATELESAFGDVVGVVGIEIDVASSRSPVLGVGALKGEIGPSPRRVT